MESKIIYTKIWHRNGKKQTETLLATSLENHRFGVVMLCRAALRHQNDAVTNETYVRDPTESSLLYVFSR